MILTSATRSIVKRELTGYFASPLGFIFIVIFVFAIGQVTFEPGKGSFFLMRQADMSSFFRYVPWLFIFLVPAVSMRLFAEERKSGTIELLFTLPITVKEAVIGKFLASWIFIIISLFCTFPMIMTVMYLGNPDLGVIIVNYMGAMLLGGSFLAIGIFFSALTKNQVVSFILSVVFCYIFLMAGSPPILGFLSKFMPSYVVDLFESLSILGHYEALGRGVVRIGDLWFFAVMIIGWPYAAILLLNENKAS
ncbi:MAG: ABC transporter permease subunit [Bacteriovoracaceae bacterium]|nr:ABC transporter permease subunit [Bacteriovoracaceae bacterium]